MPWRFAAIAFFLFLGAGAQAACTGVDLRRKVTPESLAQIRKDAAGAPFAFGNHWIASKGGRTIHVVGTLHVSDGRMSKVVRTLSPFIKSADQVFLEVDLDELEAAPGLFERDPSLFALPKGRSLKTLLSTEAWKTVFRVLSIHGFDPENIDKLQPWVVSDIVNGSNCEGKFSFSRKGLDYRIARVADRADVPLAGLEKTGTGYRALSRQRLHDQARLLELELQSTHSLDDRMVTIFETYFDQEVSLEQVLAQKLLFNDVSASRGEIARLIRQFDAQMLDWRNQLWMPKILNSEAETLFVAVGAAHLSGNNGVLNLLARAGFSLEPAPF